MNVKSQNISYKSFFNLTCTFDDNDVRLLAFFIVVLKCLEFSLIDGTNRIIGIKKIFYIDA